jgi:hypothetical protein
VNFEFLLGMSENVLFSMPVKKKVIGKIIPVTGLRGS